MSDIVIYMFSKDGCAPCQEVKPFVQELEEDYGAHTWRHLSVESKDAERLGVTKVPTMVVVHNDQPVGTHSGANKMGYYTLLTKLSCLQQK